ncbi:MAG: TolC family protein, partial [Bacteroidetes bacterium]
MLSRLNVRFPEGTGFDFCIKKINMSHLAFRLTLLFFVFSGALLAQEELSLSQAIENGLRNNYQIQIAAVNTQIAQNNNNWGTAGRYPSVNFSVTLPNSLTDQSNPASFFPELTTSGTGLTPALDAQWVLFDGFRVRLTKKQLEHLEALSEGSAKIAVENTIESVMLAYYAALIQQEQLEVLKELLDLSRDRADFEATKKAFGQSGTFERLQAQDAYLSDSTNYLLQKENLGRAFRNLNFAMGLKDLNRSYVLTDRLQFDAPTYELADLRAKMMAGNRALLNLKLNRSLAGVQTQLQKSQNYPRIALGAGTSYGLNRSRINATTREGFQFDTTTTIKNLNGFLNVTATYNIFDGGVRKRQIENARLNETILDLSLEELQQTLNMQLENALSAYQTQRQLVLLAQNQLQNAEENIRLAQERLKGGLISSFDYRT